ncbi:C4-dicarboxylate ABC transporter substrate-binding protein [Burkholderia stagnalis]|uniref:TRAP transporter substrate-binding protein DctP n=1 Tax=Burkholderia stagnalis TaxID=1503054 RepID=UPI000F5F24D4|nr:TRAP transporter substrate-binding protein DctP [Burkholderia stagnalis]RQY14886.1 C4-dicarboxylate ABC transporter substrate-binding protein [Burkholderia stagnalis]
MMKLTHIVMACFLVGASTGMAVAQDSFAERSMPGPWGVATSYPSDTVSGHAATDFARLLNEAGWQRDLAVPVFDVKGLPASLLSGATSVPFALLFASDLANDERILGLSTRPYEVKSIAEAREMALLARPAYRTALGHRDLVLLAVIPWPPTGLWSRTQISSPDNFTGMRIRTYDQSSKRVMEALGAEVVSLPIRDAFEQISRGALDGVMSSGDGAAGRAYAGSLPNFTALQYAFPLSFLVARKDFLDRLTQPEQRAVFDAGLQTERLAWERLPARVRQNYHAMNQLGVNVSDPVPQPVLDAVQHAAINVSSRAMSMDYETVRTLFELRGCIPSGRQICKSSNVGGNGER